MSAARADGRTPGMMRQLKLERAFLSRADGSARWEQDRSVVLAAVYGPRAVQSRKEDPERMVIEVVCRPASGLQTSEERELEHVVRRALQRVVLVQKHPRLGLLVVLQLVSADGGVEACAMNAASAAVMDAAVPCRGVLCAAASCSMRDGAETRGAVVADPTAEELRNCENQTVASFCFSGGRCPEDGSGDADGAQLALTSLPPSALPDAEPEVLHTTSRGVYASEEAYCEATALTRDAAANVFLFFRDRFDERASAGEGRNAHAEPGAIEARADDAMNARAMRATNPGSGGFRRTFGGDVKDLPRGTGEENAPSAMVE